MKRVKQRSPHTQLVAHTIVARACAHGMPSIYEEVLYFEVAELLDGFREYAERRAVHNLRRRAKTTSRRGTP
jgi:hypothetical protein